MNIRRKKFIDIKEASKISISWNEHSIGVTGFDCEDGVEFNVDIRNYDIDFRKGHRYEIKDLMKYLAKADREYFDEAVEEISKD